MSQIKIGRSNILRKAEEIAVDVFDAEFTQAVGLILRAPAKWGRGPAVQSVSPGSSGSERMSAAPLAKG